MELAVGDASAPQHARRAGMFRQRPPTTILEQVTVQERKSIDDIPGGSEAQLGDWAASIALSELV